MNQQRSVSIFCDFDGTISSIDIGGDLFDRFGVQEPLRPMLKRGELAIEEYWKKIVKTVETPLTPDILDPYLQSIEPTRDIQALFDLVDRLAIPFTIVSDGLSIYIDRWMTMHGLASRPVICNDAWLNPEGGLEVSFPYATEECTCKSAVCKRNVVLGRIGDDERVVYIGDGMSDFCPAELADVIFAKGDLAAYCNANGLPHHSWRTFADVVPVLDKILAGKRIRSRKRANNARMRAWGEG